MSFVPLGSLLPSAFERLDKHNFLADQHVVRLIESAFSTALLPFTDYSLSMRGRVVVVSSSSPAIKQRIFILRSKILQDITAKNPTISVRDIIFKGPQR
ncbi:MAG: hypothetical protein A3G60_00235 [Candidatus Ryanbacteria bacterium RIFCSPLOWO2_12_FULL_47_9c]|uniref:Uncharacterized protein n=2 Tax=Candidatus Ryaniibacteriota TaxID=1817914 RepID=A0A1G2H268_9BACT|nr:MAG: hypothetical protein A2844_02305 [Candidatus Ryanbacteria bacterium RIFCSPHIGHO2_01_FULL_48_80]OGZ50545.1 MAG: hypothetical protein A3C83_02510 [Candidatus Ryanbacteria bacterium RIFCSPHIGHO2_02_FULL_47_25]OGZ52658.1 MAG: hypothetical protein A3A29_00225 [Candidatus Ryanbacteria bacterium RIFCSPLOWO2_01_FULL_47_79]OGZ56400.1 MAG: hypothetical protein A3G60_00235 [Candidatus Ryanbacteria bacterium RIFCSPLOWO2_12_FULL_47_9c]OGZ56995.1 MAG: hypothetical protein A3J04_01080 [Candidatus Ryan